MPIESIRINHYHSSTVFDSSGFLPSGLLDGTLTHFGDYDECVSMNSSKYCLVFTKVPQLLVRKPEGFNRPFEQHHFNFSTQVFQELHKNLHYFRYMNLTTGLCLPRQCSRLEIMSLMQAFHDHIGTGLRVDVDLCETKIDDPPLTTAEWISAIILVSILMLNIIGYFTKPGSVLFCFNWPQNIRTLLKPRSSEDSIGCLNGIKAVTIIFVVIAHFQLGLVFASFGRAFEITKMATDSFYTIVYLTPFTVDSFFVVAGLVNSLYLFKSKRPFSPIPYFLGRWLRFAPLLVWTMCIQFWTFSKHMQQYMGGPLWGYFKATGGVVKSCERTWLTSLLLVQYWFDGPEDGPGSCFLFDWYLDVDYFFSIIFLVILIPYLKKLSHIALLNTMILIVGGIALSGFILHFLDLQHTWIVTDFQEHNLYRYTWLFNLKPWAHITPYFIGVLLGFILSKPKIHLTQPVIIVFWSICILFFTIILCHELAVNRWSVIFPYGISLAYGMLSKSLWAASVAWIIFATHQGYFMKRMNKFLSAQIFVVLARMNLSLLCTHLVFVRLRTATYRVPQNPTYFDQFFYSQMPTFVICYVAAFITAIMVEVPSIKLMKLLLQRGPRSPATSNNNDGDNKMPVQQVMVTVNESTLQSQNQEATTNSSSC